MTDETLFCEALALPDPAERAVFLAHSCPDPVQRKRIEELLAAHFASGSFLSRPAGADHAATAPLPDHATRTFDDNGTHDLPAPDHSTPAKDGVIIAGRYTLIELIGEGGMGSVWRAKQTDPVKRFVAVKLIKPGMDSRQVLARFEAERQALALMDHPNIAKVLDGGLHDGRPFFVMELVKGTPITDFCDARQISLEHRLELFVQACQAVQHAHQKGVIHRDLKPSNVLVALYDDKPVVKVIDFGVAKATGAALTERTLDTGFGGIVGTPEYMSPEQATFNNLDVDTRTDVYALGVLLYELLAGSPPFSRKELEHKGLLEILRVVREEEPPRPSTKLSTSQAKASIAASRGIEPGRLSALLSGEVDWIVMKALEKDRTRRYETATSLAADVGRYLIGEPVQAVPPSFGYRMRKAYRRNRTAVIMAAGVTLVLLIATGVSLAFGLAAKKAEGAAKDNAIRASENELAARKAETEAKNERDEQARQRARADELAFTQRLTRYAAEMTLLQSAFDAKDMRRVKQLLQAQMPAPDEPDVRGPEWYYWDRKLNGQSRELAIPLASRVTRPSHLALSPDGGWLAEVEIVTGSNGRTEAVELRHRELATGEVRHRLRTNLDRWKLRPGQIPLLAGIQIAASNDRVLIAYTHPLGGPAAGSMGQYALWDTAKEQLHFTPTPPGTRGNVTIQASDDLRLVASERRHPLGIGHVSEVIRLSDGKVVLRGDEREPVSTAFLVAPDGEHVLQRDLRFTVRREGNYGEASSDGKERLTYWRVGKDEPERRWNREIPAAHIHQFLFDPDGQKISEFRLIDGRWAWNAYNAADGELAQTRRLCDEAEGPYTRVSLTGEDLRPLRISTRHIAFKTRSGVGAISRAPNTATDPRIEMPLERWSVDSLDGPPAQFALRPDGSLVTLHLNPETKGVVIRAWPLAPAPQPSPFRTGALARDRSLIVFLASTNGGARQTLCVRGNQSETLLDLPLGEDELALLPSGVTDTGERFHDITPDHRYLAAVVCIAPKFGETKFAIVAWDLRSGREVVRLPTTQEEHVNGISMNEAGDRLLVNVGCTRAEQPAGSQYRLYDLPGGRLVRQIDRPEPGGGLALAVFVGATIRKEVFPRKNGVARYLTWSAQDGELLSDQTVPRPIESEQSSQTFGEWVVTTGRVPGASPQRWFIEVRNRTPRAEGSAPLFQLVEDSPRIAELSPDGRRLMVTRGPGRFALYCVRSGRQVAELQTTASTGEGIGFWSGDSKRFWTGYGTDKQLAGFDFRPREEPKK